MISVDSRKITESARIGSTDSSDGSILVRAIASPNIQLAKSVEKLSARNLQILSIILGFYHLPIAYSLLDRYQTTNSQSPKTSSQNLRSPTQC
ncbi:MAG: hypothetical protein ACKO7R_05020 [Pseudanabaena sp.]